MTNFEYCRPASLLEAAAVLQENPGAIILSGGTDVMVRLKKEAISPTLLVDLKSLGELKEISVIGESGLRVGSAVTLTRMIEEDLIRRRCPVLSQAAALMACVQVRNRATIGGNLVNASPSADTAPPLISVDAEMEIFGGGETRRVFIADFFTGPGETVLKKGEILTAIVIPDIPRKAHYIKHTLRKAMDIAGVSVSLSRKEDGAPDPRLVLGAVAPTPIRVPEAEALIARGKVEEAGAVAAQTARPIDDVRASADYRRLVTPPLVKRAYREVFENRNRE